METNEEQQNFDQLQILAGTLSRKFDECVKHKTQVETRWLKDLRQFHGKNEPDEESRLTAAHKSKLFVNITRNKTIGGEARLISLLFPSDDRNWGIKPTPVPELEDKVGSEEQIEIPADAVGPDGLEGGVTTTEDDLAAAEMSEAKKRSIAMEREIDDQLTECDYNAACREIIHDAATLGTGIIKGPFPIARAKKSWKKVDGDVYALEMREAIKPGVERVNPWNFFPDSTATCIEDAEFIFERRFMTRQQIRSLAKRPGYLTEHIRVLLDSAPQSAGTVSDHRVEVREITGADQGEKGTQYEVIEYHGPIAKEDLLAAGIDLGDDPLIEMMGVVQFCDNHVLRVKLNPLETGELPYSVFCWEPDNTSIFGFGVPYLMASSQKVINAAWRMLMDNAALSMGPQIVMKRGKVEPADGVWEVTARKLWYATDETSTVHDVFGFHEISSHQAELMDIFTRARQIADEETNLPVIAQGEQSAQVTKTFMGMQLLQQNADVVLKRSVKRWDDNITDPTITRFYDWNMQNSEKENIKGDFYIDARGTSALMDRLAMEQGAVQWLQITQGFASILSPKMLQALREAAKSLKLDPDMLVPTDEEAKAMQPQGNPEAELKQAEMQLKQQQLQNVLQLGQSRLDLDRELGMAKIAAQEKLTLEQLYQNLGMEREKLATERQVKGTQMMNQQDEMALKTRMGSGI